MKLKHTICLLLSAVSLTACSAKYDVYTEPTADYPMIGQTIQLKPGLLIKDLSKLNGYIYESRFGPKAKKMASITNLNTAYAYNYFNQNRYTSIMESIKREDRKVIEQAKLNLVNKPEGITCRIKKVYLMQPLLTEGIINDAFVGIFSVASCENLKSDILIFDFKNQK